jgi:polysaccharide export outer membrane protein
MVALVIVADRAYAQSGSDYVIGPQDVLAITLYGQADLSGRYTVEADGTFSFPLVGRVDAAGRTMREFEVQLREKLADGFFRNPQVAIAVEQYRSQRVFVVGEVREPGSYALTGDMTLIEVLARAGSLGGGAAGEVVVVRAQGARSPQQPPQTEANEVIRVSLKALESGDLSKNVALRDGDTIFVPRAESVYVFGQVKNPGLYPMQPEMTVLQVLALAGGVTTTAAVNRARIVRFVDGEKKELRIRLNDVVQPGDTVVIPARYF